MSTIATSRSHQLAHELDETFLMAPRGKLLRLPVAPSAAEQHILVVWFRSPDGRTWNAIGGGTTVGEAIDWARECCPEDTTWHPVSWDDLYGA
jgi:hypothetical protein